MTAPVLPHVPSQAGRLRDPDASPATDDRMDPRLRVALAAFGLDQAAADPPVTRADGMAAMEAAAAAAHQAFNGLYAVLPIDVPGDAEVAFSEHTVTGRDGHVIGLRVYRPEGLEGALPAVVYLHGGGMTILDTHAPVHQRWCQDLAATGMVAILVDYRNAWTAAGLNPFPTGLHDCYDAVAWISEHRAELGIDQLVLQGESGGANLTLATVLLSAREDRRDLVDGVAAAVPYISGAYAWPTERKLAELPSLVENDGFFINTGAMDHLVAIYDADGAHAEDPLCWPYFATAEDVAGLPPHLVTVNELDPLRDEGIAYVRTLRAAGVPTTASVNLGLTHGAELIFRQSLPEANATAVAAIHAFARSLRGA